MTTQRLILFTLSIIVSSLFFPISAAHAQSKTGVTLATLGATAGGMVVGGAAGAVTWVAVEGAFSQCAEGQGNDIECGLGPVMRTFFLGVPAGAALGGGGAGLLTHSLMTHATSQKQLAWGGGTALLGATLIATTPLHESPVLLVAGAATGLIVSPALVVGMSPWQKEGSQLTLQLGPTVGPEGVGWACRGQF